jgi:hypothetical protein
MSNQSTTNPLIHPHQMKRYDSDPDPHESDELDPDPHQLTDDKPKCREYEPIRALFQSFSLYLEGRIGIRTKVKGRIRIRIKVTSRIRIRNTALISVIKSIRQGK